MAYNWYYWFIRNECVLVYKSNFSQKIFTANFGASLWVYGVRRIVQRLDRAINCPNCIQPDVSAVNKPLFALREVQYAILPPCFAFNLNHPSTRTENVRTVNTELLQFSPSKILFSRHSFSAQTIANRGRVKLAAQEQWLINGTIVKTCRSL